MSDAEKVVSSGSWRSDGDYREYGSYVLMTRISYRSCSRRRCRDAQSGPEVIRGVPMRLSSRRSTYNFAATGRSRSSAVPESDSR